MAVSRWTTAAVAGTGAQLHYSTSTPAWQAIVSEFFHPSIVMMADREPITVRAGLFDPRPPLRRTARHEVPRDAAPGEPGRPAAHVDRDRTGSGALLAEESFCAPSTSPRSRPRAPPMRAVVIDELRRADRGARCARPVCPPDGVVVRVEATGLCRSDWHGWQGTTRTSRSRTCRATIRRRHRGGRRRGYRGGGPATGSPRRSSAPAVAVPPARAATSRCASGRPSRVSPHWGSSPSSSRCDHADVNLVAVLPDAVDFGTAARLGCRFATAFRAVVHHGRVARGRVGRGARLRRCRPVGGDDRGGRGARVVAVDVSPAALELARAFGAAECRGRLRPRRTPRSRCVT